MFEEPKNTPQLENPHNLFGQVGKMSWEDVVIPIKYLSREELQKLFPRPSESLTDSSSLDSPPD